jgi:sugar lactone lactonase YvrE
MAVDGRRALLLPSPRSHHSRLFLSHPPHLSKKQGVFAPNAALRSAVRLFDGLVAGSESVAVAPNGTLVMCDRYGFVWHADAPLKGKGKEKNTPLSASAFSQPRRVAHLGPGRPLGFHHDGAGNLVVCMAGGGGLVRLDAASGRVEVLASVAHEREGAGGDHAVSPHPFATPGPPSLSPILYANDLDIDPVDGSVYFTDSAAIAPVLNGAGFTDTLRAYLLSLFQGGKTGRVLRWDPATGVATVVATGLAYANGIALLPPESPGQPATHAAVVETNALRVVRVALTGPEVGRVEPFLTGLPGFPDGLSRGVGDNAGKTLWLALIAPPSPLARWLGPRLVRWVAAWAPRPPLGAWGAAVRVDAATGAPLQAFYDLGGSVVSSTSAVTDGGGGRLYLGNLNGAYVSVVDVGGEGCVGGRAHGSADKSARAGGGGGGGGGDGGRDEL